jgi:hypothetical protein
MSLNRYDDFSINMGALNALQKFKGSFSNDQIEGENLGHDHDPLTPGNGGIIRGSSISGSVSHSLSATDATNVTQTINSVPLISIFEPSYLVVKNSTDSKNVTSTIAGKSIDSIFEQNSTYVKNSTNATKLNNLTSNYYQNFYIPSENILLEKLTQQTVDDDGTIVAAVMTIYTPGIYTISADIKINVGVNTSSVDFLWFNHINLYSSETHSTSYTTKTSNIFIPAGKLYVKLTCTTPSPQMDPGTAYIRNIRLKGQLGAVPASIIS